MSKSSKTKSARRVRPTIKANVRSDPSNKERIAWRRGWCACLACYLRENFSEGVSGTESDSLFGMILDGWKDADENDIATFHRHGLVTDEMLAKRSAEIMLADLRAGRVNHRFSVTPNARLDRPDGAKEIP